jgi:hypothetical protein
VGGLEPPVEPEQEGVGGVGVEPAAPPPVAVPAVGPEPPAGDAAGASAGGDQSDEPQGSPQDSPDEDTEGPWRARLIAFYSVYNPSKLVDVASLLERHKDKVGVGVVEWRGDLFGRAWLAPGGLPALGRSSMGSWHRAWLCG